MTRRALIHIDFFGGKSVNGWMEFRCQECEEFDCSCKPRTDAGAATHGDTDETTEHHND